MTKYVLAKAHTTVAVVHPQTAPSGGEQLPKTLEKVSLHHTSMRK